MGLNGMGLVFLRAILINSPRPVPYTLHAAVVNSPPLKYVPGLLA